MVLAIKHMGETLLMVLQVRGGLENNYDELGGDGGIFVWERRMGTMYWSLGGADGLGPDTSGTSKVWIMAISSQA